MAKAFMGLVGMVLLAVGGIGFFYPFDGMLDLTSVHNIIHLATGFLAILACSSQAFSVIYARLFGTIYFLLGVLGLFTHNLFGLVMLDRTDTILHFALGAIALFIGYRSSMQPSPKQVVS